MTSLPYVEPTPTTYRPKADFDAHLELENCKDALLDIRKIHIHAVPYHDRATCPCRTCLTLLVIERVIAR